MGSDVGQSTLWDYSEKVAMARAATDFLTEAEARAFLHDNAARIFGLAERDGRRGERSAAALPPAAA